MARDDNGRFVRGQSGNPRGRPKKGQALTEILEKHAKKRDVEFHGRNISRKEALSQKLWSLALSGDVAAIRYIFDRIDGRPRQDMDLNAEIDTPSGVLVVPGTLDPEDWDRLAREQQAGNEPAGDE
ncbi:MAG: DUF5681 domain-containing protein [Alkalispirochaeta sp.]